MRTVRLGDTDASPRPERALEAGGLLVSGLVTAAAIVLYASGYPKHAAALGASAAIVGAVAAAARALD